MKNYGLILVIFIAAVVILVVYLLFSFYTAGIGFPLDDAWIHQTYARNLAKNSAWEYIPGIASAGSTSPLWTIFLAFGYLLNASPIFWSFLLNSLGITGIVWIGYVYLKLNLPIQKYLHWMVVAIILFEYHLNWSALSGMETIFFAFIIVLVLFGNLLWQFPVTFVGMIVGISVWLRPDGLTLLFPVIFLEFFKYRFSVSFLKRSFQVVLGFAAIFIAYLAFNYFIAGTIWPSTYYAKQAEYASMLTTPLLFRTVQLYSQPLIGVGILLLPGFVFRAVQAIKTDNYGEIVAYLWWIGFIGLYVFRLPVIYQHARYLIPGIPVYIILAISGIPGLIGLIKKTEIRFILQRVWGISIIFVLLGFWYIGAKAFATDVAVIESEMVDVSKWIANSIEPDAIIAAHDIGALGYYGDHNILDLAGLISPDVIPIIDNEAALVQLINISNAQYLMTFPDWYKNIAECAEMMYTSGGSYVQQYGRKNMVLYKWDGDCNPADWK